MMNALASLGWASWELKEAMVKDTPDDNISAELFNLHDDNSPYSNKSNEIKEVTLFNSWL